MRGIDSVEEYIERHSEWRDELARLRRILKGAGLEETIKWGGPCYTLGGKNVVGLGAFTKHVALWFHQGILLEDPEGVLVNAQEGKTKALRQWRFAKGEKIPSAKVKVYVREAVENQRKGRELRPERGKAVVLPPLLKEALAKRPRARAAFAGLTPGRQREYAEFVASAKLEKTRAARLEKILPSIEAGVGLNDRYRSK